MISALVLAAGFSTVQLGSFSDETRAVHAVEDLRKEGLDAYFLRYPSPEEGAATFKVRVGSFADAAGARAMTAKMKAKGYPDAFATTTELAETQTLSASVQAAVVALGKPNQGRVKAEKDGKTVWVWVQDYLTVWLLADPEKHPGREITDLATWDTNMGNEAEIFAVLDGRHAYGCWWNKDTSRYEVVSLALDAGKLSIGTFSSLASGNDFLSIRYQQGGSEYQESGIDLFRFEDNAHVFTEVGRIPLSIEDHGEDPRAANASLVTQTRGEPAADDVDDDGTTRELVMTHTVQGKDHLDVWHWDGKRVEHADTAWLTAVSAKHPENAKLSEYLFGAGVDRAIAGDLDGASEAFQKIIADYTDQAVATRAKQALDQIHERTRKADAYNQTGFEELRGGAPELAVDDLQRAVVLDPGHPKAWYNLAAARTAAGDALGALQALRTAVDLDKDEKLKLRDQAKQDPDLAPLRDLPELKEILR